MKLSGRDELIGVKSEPVKIMDGFWHRPSINKLTTGHSVVWLGTCSLGFSGSLSDCPGSVTVFLPFRKSCVYESTENAVENFQQREGNEFIEIWLIDARDWMIRKMNGEAIF